MIYNQIVTWTAFAILAMFIRYDTILIRNFGLRNDLFLGIYCLTTFFGGIFDGLFRHFFNELLLNKEGRESGALELPKMCVFGLKSMTFLAKKRQKNHNFHTITNIEDSIL